MTYSRFSCLIQQLFIIHLVVWYTRKNGIKKIKREDKNTIAIGIRSMVE